MAAQVGLSQTAVSRIWRAFGLQPHRLEGWKLSKVPFLIDKVRDVVGLYLAPPERAVVLCVDEKSQIQALERSTPILPLLPATPARQTHDHTRYGTSRLYAALNLTSGLQLVLDNSSTHKTPEIKRWLAGHPRVVLHFTPTSSSWLNLVERCFAELTTKKLRRGSHRSV
jgi:hypothetical protein